MNKFEQLIEFVINDEQDKAQELFHEIVVEKSRDIYESIMAEEETVEEDVEEVSEDETVEESFDVEEEMGGSESIDLIQDIEAEEEGITLGEEEGEEAEDLEDRVVSVEDKLDELMAEFEELMSDLDSDQDGDHDMEDHEAEEGGMDMDAEEEDEEVEMMDMEMESLEEGADLTAAPKPVTSEEGSVNTKGANNDNAGAKGAEAKPQQSSGEEKGRTAPKAQDQGMTTAPDLKKV